MTPARPTLLLLAFLAASPRGAFTATNADCLIRFAATAHSGEGLVAETYRALFDSSGKRLTVGDLEVIAAGGDPFHLPPTLEGDPGELRKQLEQLEKMI